MKTWNDLSDLEINKAIYEAIGLVPDDLDILAESITNQLIKAMPFMSNEDECVCIYYGKDYCNNPADMWPIIGDRKISLHWDWEVMNECSAIGSTYVMRSLGLRQITHEYTSKNPLRAAAIVFLMMNGVNPE